MSRTPTPLFREMASLINARTNCQKAGNGEWFERHTESLEALVDFLPSGSGIDNGITLDLDDSRDDKLVFNFSYHHMNENGMYDGWTDHQLIVRPTLMAPGFDTRITGRDQNGVKEYLYDLFHDALTSLVWQEETAPGEWTYKTSRWHPMPEKVGQ